MSNKMTWIVVVALVIVGVIGGVYYFSSKSVAPADRSGTDVAPAVPGPESVPAVGQAETGQASVAIRDFSFLPSKVTVKKGTTVTWLNIDSAAHDVVGTDGKLPEFRSDRLEQNEKYNFTFDEIGSFAYYCSIHPSMRGTVIVVE